MGIMSTGRAEWLPRVLLSIAVLAIVLLLAAIPGLVVFTGFTVLPVEAPILRFVLQEIYTAHNLFLQAQG